MYEEVWTLALQAQMFCARLVQLALIIGNKQVLVALYVLKPDRLGGNLPITHVFRIFLMCGLYSESHWVHVSRMRWILNWAERDLRHRMSARTVILVSSMGSISQPAPVL